MELGCCGKTFSCLFIFFNFIFAVVGMATIGFGIFIKVHPSPTQFLTQIELHGYEQYLNNSAWIIIVFGALVLLVSFCGCVGASNKSECLLGMYITFSLIISFGVLAIFISTIVYFVRFEDLDHFTGSLTKTLQTKYKEKATEFTKPWDYVQSQFQCCGVSSYKDYDAVFTGNDKGKVPPSCCASSDNGTEAPEAASSESCPNDMYSEVCFGKLQAILNDYSSLLLVAEFFIITLAIIGIIIAACLCRGSGEKDNYSTL
ncbi:CD82 antigen-like [Haliotis rufescens]|uniref:CD82 antigen-like n=1 Tax=Haliotis rufescens TaxID=6454 RepID=UPI00201EF363|nr:CD82 antigen-like [Haliotis rufescens]